jgi:hypothetical protein
MPRPALTAAHHLEIANPVLDRNGKRTASRPAVSIATLPDVHVASRLMQSWLTRSEPVNGVPRAAR